MDILITIVLFVSVIYAFFSYRKVTLKLESDALIAKQKVEIAAKYRDALNSGNKSDALSLGRQYYASLRDDGVLTIYDEQALANDLLAMGDTKR